MAIAHGRRDRAEDAAGQIAERAWSARTVFGVHNAPVEDAVSRAARAPRGPVVLVDVGDNIGGGGPGDGTVLLGALLEADAKSAVVVIADHDAVATAHREGVGATAAIPVGGRIDGRHGPPVQIAGRVRSVTDGQFVNRGPHMTGAVVEMGRCAVVYPAAATHPSARS